MDASTSSLIEFARNSAKPSLLIAAAVEFVFVAFALKVIYDGDWRLMMRDKRMKIVREQWQEQSLRVRPPSRALRVPCRTVAAGACNGL